MKWRPGLCLSLSLSLSLYPRMWHRSGSRCTVMLTRCDGDHIVPAIAATTIDAILLTRKVER